MFLPGLFVLLIFGVICFGWVILLVAGIKRKKNHLSGSIVLITIACLWALPGIAIAFMSAFSFSQYKSYEDPKTIVFDPDTYEGQTGTVTLSCTNNVSLEFYTTNSLVSCQVNGSNGLITLPAGKIALYSMKVEGNDENGPWYLSAYFRNRNNLTVNVLPDHITPLQAGPPLAAKVSVKPRGGRRISLGFKLQGIDGADYTIRPSNRRRQVPRFEIRDKVGNLVLADKFSYG